MVSSSSKKTCVSCHKPGNNATKLSEIKCDHLKNRYGCETGDMICKKCRDEIDYISRSKSNAGFFMFFI